jgi:hypothetical protein
VSGFAVSRIRGQVAGIVRILREEAQVNALVDTLERV